MDDLLGKTAFDFFKIEEVFYKIVAGIFSRWCYLFLVEISFKFALTSQNVWQETTLSELGKETCSYLR